MGQNVLQKLEQNALQSGFGKKDPKFLLFSRLGFTPALKKLAKQRTDLYLFEPKDLLARGRITKPRSPQQQVEIL